MAGQDAIDYAAQLDEIGFPEFTTKLISDVFDSLIAANMRQQQGFIELVQATSKSLTDFIDETSDDVGPEEIMQFLSAVAPPEDPDGSSAPTKVAVGTSLTAAEATAVNDALATPAEAGVTDDNKVAKSGNINQAGYDAILTAVAKRISVTRFDVLKEMVKVGMLRLVVDDGTIETKLNFHAYGSEYFNANQSSYKRSTFDFRAKAKTGGLLSSWVKAAASTSYNSVRVSTSSSNERSGSGVDVKIYGGVTVNFHTDYLPLADES